MPLLISFITRRSCMPEVLAYITLILTAGVLVLLLPLLTERLRRRP